MANTAINHDPAATFPGSSTDTAVVKWSGTGGKTLVNSGVTIDASNNLTVPGNVTTTGYVHLTGDEKALRFYNGSNFISIAAPSGLGADYTFTLPLNDGGASEFLQTNGSGVLTWAAAIANDSIVEGKLNVSNGPTNGQVLTARDGVAGGFTWEAAASGGVDTTGTPANNQIAIFTDADTLEGVAGLTFDGTLMYLTGTGISTIQRTTSGTTNIAAPVHISNKTSQDAADGFGPVINFQMTDTGVTDQQMGYLGYRRDGADNSARFIITTSSGGTVAERFTVKNDGNVGVGTTSPSGIFHVAKSGDTKMYVQCTSASDWAALQFLGNGGTARAEVRGSTGSGRSDAGSLYILTSDTYRMAITSGGNVGVGNNTAPLSTLHVKTASAGSYSIYSGGDDFILENSSSCGMTVATPDANNSFWCHATPSGGSQNSGFYTGYGSGTPYFAIMNAGGEKFKIAGNDVTGAHGSYHTSSDARIKENVVDITYGLNAVMAMRPVEYDFCDWYNPAIPDKTRLGFIAQEVKAVVPEIVNIATDPRSFQYKADDDTPVVETHETIEDMHSIEEQQIIPILVKAIQELNAKIDALGS